MLWLSLTVPSSVAQVKLIFREVETEEQQGLRDKVLAVALNAYDCADSQGLIKKPLLTVIDYSLASNQKRAWIVDPREGHILKSMYVAHGSGSGNKYATHFSNRPNTHASSLGAYLTASPYYGSHGYSLKLKGLEDGLNDNAEKRHIVMHSAWYVNDDFLKTHDRLGRSWGCFSINPAFHRQVIDQIKGGSMVFAYAPSEDRDPHIEQCQFKA